MSRSLVGLLLVLVGLLGLTSVVPATRAGAEPASAVRATADTRSVRQLPPGSRITWQGEEWYLFGANMAWVTWSRDFGGGEADGVSSAGTRALLDERLANAKANGVNVVRWWVFEGDAWQINRDESGAPAGLNEAIYQDFDAALELAETHDLSYVFVLFSAPHHLPSSWLENPEHRKALANSLAPLFARYADNHRVMSWEAFNEPDFDVWSGKTREEHLRETIREIGRAVHANSIALYTVGMAMLDGLPMVKGLGLDYYQAHWYDYMQPGAWCAICTTYDEVQKRYNLDAPLVIGELYLGADIENPHVRLQDFYSKGYAGAWPWSIYPEGTEDKLQIDWNSMRIFAGRHLDLGPRKTPALMPSAAPPTQRLGFNTTAQAAEVRVAPGTRLPIDVKVTSTAATRVVVDIEVYSPAGEKVHQEARDDQSFGPGETKAFTTFWQVPGDAPPGEYVVKVGIFTPGWGNVHDWNDRAGTFTVGR
jgi:hypothetical protein